MRAPRRIPLAVDTIYANLGQLVRHSDNRNLAAPRPGSISRKTVDGKVYLYAVERSNGARSQRYLGPAEDPHVIAQAEAIRAAMGEARHRRMLVSMLKRAGVPAPPSAMARLLQAVAEAGLFKRGLVLVGTGAYQLYAPVVGAYLSAATSITEDADFAVASILDAKGDAPLVDVLRRADPSFAPRPGFDPRQLPKRFRNAAGFEVEILTPVRTRGDTDFVGVPDLGAGAVPLHFLEFLLADATPVVALHGAGFEVRVPEPARYAVHKLIIGQIRRDDGAKRRKDLAQAGELISSLEESDQHAVEDALAEARSRGPKWRSAIAASLRDIGRPEL